jgi:hypothetical protein
MVSPIPFAIASEGSEININPIQINPPNAMENPNGRKPRGSGPTGDGPENVAISEPIAIKATGPTM